MSISLSHPQPLLECPLQRIVLSSTEHGVVQSLHIPFGLLQALPVLLPLLVCRVIRVHFEAAQRTRVGLSVVWWQKKR